VLILVVVNGVGLIQIRWKGMKTPYPATAPSQMTPSAMSLACKKSLSLSLS